MTVSFTQGWSHEREESVPEVEPVDMSLAIGRFYLPDFHYYQDRPDELAAYFSKVQPYINAVKEVTGNELGREPRIDTSILVGDISVSPEMTPRKIIRDLIGGAIARAGVLVDHAVMESGLVANGPKGWSIADAAVQRIYQPPDYGAGGSGQLSPQPHESGWVSNGFPSGPKRDHPLTLGRAHTLYQEVRLFSQNGRERTYSPTFLAALCQLGILGLLSNYGAVFSQPEYTGIDEIEDWSEWPPIVSFHDMAGPLRGITTGSILPQYFLPMEAGIDIIIDQFNEHIDRDETASMREAALVNGFELPRASYRREMVLFLETQFQYEPSARSFS